MKYCLDRSTYLLIYLYNHGGEREFLRKRLVMNLKVLVIEHLHNTLKVLISLDYHWSIVISRQKVPN